MGIIAVYKKNQSSAKGLRGAGLFDIYSMMRLHLLLICVSTSFALLVFSCAASPHPVLPEQHSIPDDFSGLVHAGSTNTRKEYNFLNYLDAGWILHTFNWSGIEPEQGEWDFMYYDTLVDKARAGGKKVLGLLAYDNWWIHEDLDTHFYIPPERLPDYLNYIRETVSHFRGRVDAWCIWNEPNFIFWNGTDEEFFVLARQAADAVREIDTEVTLLGGAFNRGFFGLPEKFIRGLFESGAMEKVDAVAFHPYELNPRRAARLYDRFRAVVSEYGFGDKIWITEIGYPTGGMYPTAVSEKKFPAYVIKTFTLLAVRGSRKLLWYQLFDPHKRKRSDSEDFFGLVRSRRDYRSKGAEAFRLCAGNLSGAVYYAQKPQREKIPGSVQSFYFEKEGLSTLILWNEGFPRKISIKLGGTGHTRHDPVTGAAAPIPEDLNIKLGSMPVFITWRNMGSELCTIASP
jgi:hypothetical protein